MSLSVCVYVECIHGLWVSLYLRGLWAGYIEAQSWRCLSVSLSVSTICNGDNGKGFLFFFWAQLLYLDLA